MKHPYVKRASAKQAALLFAMLLLLPACGGDPGPAADFAPPSLEEWSGEALVAAKLDALRRDAVAAPESAAKIGRLGEAFHAHELHGEAVACYRRAMELAPEEPRWPYLAALATAEGDLEASVELFARAAELNGASPAPVPAIHVNHGDVLVQLGRGDEAAAEYRRALALEPATPHALYGLARVESSAGDLETAVGHLEQAAALPAHNAEVHGLLAQLYRRLGRDDEAELAVLRAGAGRAARTADPVVAAMEGEAVSTQAIGRRGRRLADAGRYAEAEAAFRKVIELRPPNARDLSNLGGAVAAQGRLDEAIDLYDQALEIDPEETYTLNNRGLALAERGDLEAAAANLARAVEIDPAYAEAHTNLALVRSRQRRHAEAAEHYRAALEQDPSKVAAYTGLGGSLAAVGDLDAAIAAWRRGVEIDPTNLASLHNLAVALTQAGEHGEAIRWLERGLETAPNSSRLATLLAWELATAPEAAVRDPKRAEELARRVSETYPRQPQAADVLAAALAAQGRFDLAVPVAERALGLAQQAGDRQLVAEIGSRLASYRRGQAFVQ
ncbi:MAG TPA: tetratricopeptide repeat protein [Thermoanaerobaculia bacterium]|nr:tetratricopeptide repeat protein [Thermoanaerobaculia bacterium]